MWDALKWMTGRRAVRRSRRFQVQLEVLEVRQLLATFTVTTTSDSGAGSLRDAIVQSNNAAGADTITFAIPGAGVKTISPLSALPTLTGPVTIDGTTQGAITTNPLIEISGISAGAASNGLVVSGGSSVIRAITVNRFAQSGISVTSSGNTIDRSFIGVNSTGSAAAPNGVDGIRVTGNGNLIGGPGVGAGNLISGNTRNGVLLTGAGATGNNIQNNTIGTDRLFSVKVSNGQAGVRISEGAQTNVVGGTLSGVRNFISGNGGAGVLIDGVGTNSNLVQGNFLGNGQLIASSLGNLTGVSISGGAQNNVVGDSSFGGMNIISANTQFGVTIRGAGTTGNRVIGNRIGTDSTGATPLGNTLDGISIDSGAAQNLVGGAFAGEGNLISGNLRNGIVLSGAGVTLNDVNGNRVGLNNSGNAAIPNAAAGVVIQAGATSNFIGGSGTISNVISGNSQNGITIRGTGTSGNFVGKNLIGLNPAGTAAIPNVLEGVVIESSATGNRIGGSIAADSNTISGNGRAGVRISGTGTNSNLVRGNRIGTNPGGTSAIANRIGVWILGGAQSNTVGGDLIADRNLLSGNSIYGVSISGNGTELNVILNNRIGTNETEVAALANGFDGISIAAGAKNNRIGRNAAGVANNVIAGNSRHGISISGAGTTGNLVLGNHIGLSSVNTGIPNGRHGIAIYGGATGTVIGNNLAGTRNVIASNNGFGIAVTGAGSSATIQNNLIGITATSSIQGNASGGILVSAAGTAMIGGTATSARNVISGNFGFGVVITDSGTTGVTIQGNFIGTDVTGNIKKGNNDTGVLIQQGASNVTVGGTASGAGNVISGNSGNGIRITEVATHHVTIQGNFIGTNAAGTAAIANAAGIRLDFATQVTIGGTTSTARNVISGNTFDGITIVGNNSVGADTENVIQGNFIGLNAAGTAAIPNKDGIQISVQDRRITIGGGSSGAANFISGNSRFGIRVSESSNHRILGNRIGTRADGITAQGNGSHGIFVFSDSGNNRLGGELPGEGNLIANNGGDGVLVGSDAAAGFAVAAGTGNSILGNRIFGNAGQAIDLGPNDGASANDLNDPDTGSNNLQNKSVLTFATSSDGSTMVTGSLDSVIGTFRIEFFVGTLTGQAEDFVGATTETIVDTNDVSFASVFEFAITPGRFLVATVTNLDTGDTSELSLGLAVL